MENFKSITKKWQSFLNEQEEKPVTSNLGANVDQEAPEVVTATQKDPKNKKKESKIVKFPTINGAELKKPVLGNVMSSFGARRVVKGKKGIKKFKKSHRAIDFRAEEGDVVSVIGAGRVISGHTAEQYLEGTKVIHIYLRDVLSKKKSRQFANLSELASDNDTKSWEWEQFRKNWRQIQKKPDQIAGAIRTFKREINKYAGINFISDWLGGVWAKVKHTLDNVDKNGKHIVIYSYYMHLKTIELDPKASPIGYVGNTGVIDSDVHLHLAIRGSAGKLDPGCYLSDLDATSKCPEWVLPGDEPIPKSR